MNYIGIDPGLHGGLAIIAETGGKAHIRAVPLPVMGDEIDGALLAGELRLCQLDGVAVVTIEKVGAMPGQGLSSTFKFGKGYGTVIGVCAALGLRIELVTPQKWKGVILAGTAKDKDAAIDYARRAFPMLALVQPCCRVPHDGVADAVAIAEYGRRTYR